MSSQYQRSDLVDISALIGIVVAFNYFHHTFERSLMRSGQAAVCKTRRLLIRFGCMAVRLPRADLTRVRCVRESSMAYHRYVISKRAQSDRPAFSPLLIRGRLFCKNCWHKITEHCRLPLPTENASFASQQTPLFPPSNSMSDFTKAHLLSSVSSVISVVPFFSTRKPKPDKPLN